MSPWIILLKNGYLDPCKIRMHNFGPLVLILLQSGSKHYQSKIIKPQTAQVHSSHKPNPPLPYVYPAQSKSLNPTHASKNNKKFTRAFHCLSSPPSYPAPHLLPRTQTNYLVPTSYQVSFQNHLTTCQMVSAHPPWQIRGLRLACYTWIHDNLINLDEIRWDDSEMIGIEDMWL